MGLDGGGAKFEQKGRIYSIPNAGDLVVPAGVVDDTVDRVFARDDEVRRHVEALRARILPPGEGVTKWNLSPLLDKRRMEHLIPDGAFDSMPMFDRVHIYQIGQKQLVNDGVERHGDTSIIMTENAKGYTRESNPRGIIVGAGLQALDSLRSHGADLGHIVRFQRLSPYRHEIDNVFGRPYYILVMNVGCITASEDAEEDRRSGGMKVVIRDGRHVIYRQGDMILDTVRPWISEDT